MLNGKLILSLFLVTGISFAGAYDLNCQGKKNSSGVRIELHTTAETVVRSFRQSNGALIADPATFTVQSYNPFPRQFGLKGIANVAFTGGGKLEGALVITRGVSTWTETLTTFNERTGQTKKVTTPYPVACVARQ